MFHLETAITEWRNQMLAAGIKSPVPLEELESHLREDIEQQARAGLNGRRAFEAAVQKIGRAGIVHREFSKVNENNIVNQRRIDAVSSVVCAAVAAVTSTAVFLLPPFWSQMNFRERMTGFAGIVMGVLFLCGWRCLSKFLPVISSKWILVRVQFGSAALGTAIMLSFLAFIWPRFEAAGQSIVALVCALMIPLGLFGGIAYGLGEAARCQNGATDS